MVKKIFVYIYTKTFGGKISNDLHRVSPEKVFAKKSNKVSFKFFRQKLLEQHLVQEKLFHFCQIEFFL